MDAPARPHIVLFNPDQWRSDALGHLGNPAARTPVLDALVQTDAVSFRNAFCQNPVCTPSRCSFMTGWYPHVRGHRTMFHMLGPDEPCLLSSLKDAGYHVFWGGKNDLVRLSTGFAPYCDVKYTPPEPVRPMWAMDREATWRGSPGSDSYYSFQVGRLDAADPNHDLDHIHDHYTDHIHYHDSDWANVLGAIDQVRTRPPDKPLCLYLPLTYPHPPYAVEDPWFSAIDRAALPPRIPATPDPATKPSILAGIRDRQNLQDWSEDRWDELRATYLGMGARVDTQFGMLMEALKDAGIYDDTLVIVFSDHGDYTGDYGIVEKTQNTFEDCLTRVPLIVKPAQGMAIRPGIRDALVELIDIPATVEAATGIAPGHTHFGHSLLPLVAGGTDRHRDAVFCEGGRLPGEGHASEAASPGASDPANLYWPRVNLQVIDPVAHTKAIMCRTATHKYVRRLAERDELYDLTADPYEEHNRIDDPALAPVQRSLQDRLLTHLLETADVVPHRIDPRH
ncbi:MAG: sulfatase-like hydrolase/transferase [Thermomicrobiales bacterium]